MKVYATVKQEGEVKLLSFSSQKAFMAEHSWIDPQFISIALSSDLELYEFPYEGGMIVVTQDQIDSHNLLHKQYKISR